MDKESNNRNKQRVDLHMHSYCSDGIMSPRELCKYAKDNCIELFSITDHNTIAAYDKIDLTTEKNIITGLEIDVSFNQNDNIEFLCYDFDISNKFIKKQLENIQKARLAASIQLLRKIKKLGITIDITDPLFKHIGDFDYICNFLVERGLTKDIRTLREKYFGESGELYCYVPRVNAIDCIRMIHEALGFVVLAHPIRISSSLPFLSELIFSLKKIGLDGIECFHPDHDHLTQDFLLNMARRFSLKITGGSDMHGKSTNFILYRSNICI